MPSIALSLSECVYQLIDKIAEAVKIKRGEGAISPPLGHDHTPTHMIREPGTVYPHGDYRPRQGSRTKTWVGSPA